MSSTDFMDEQALCHHVRIQICSGGYVIHIAHRDDELDEDGDESIQMQTKVALTLEGLLDIVKAACLAWEGSVDTPTDIEELTKNDRKKCK